MSTPSVLTISQRLGQHHTQWQQADASLSRQIRVAVPATVVTADMGEGGTQTVTVQPAVNEEVLIGGQVVKMSLPQLIKVPVVLYRSGGFSITTPIMLGDECLVIFTDMAHDGWWQNGAASNPQDQVEIRRHDLSDGVAIFGLWSQPRRLSNYSTTSMQLRSDDGQTVIDIADGKVTITAANVSVVTPQMNVAASGGTAVPLVSQGFLAWFEEIFMEAVSYKTGVAPVPPATGLLTTVLGGE